jgi:predicted metal-binding membrane protein
LRSSQSRDRRMYGVMALAFIASTAITLVWCKSMSAMPGMEMPGGWTMTMMWMRMPGQTWLEAGGTFLAMWTVMMMAMMLPVFASALRRLRREARGGRALPVIGVAAGYFGVWASVGLFLFPVGVGFNALAMRSEMLSEVTPLLGGLVVMVAGALQVASWKTRALVLCRHEEDRCGSQQGMPRDALRAGVRLGLKCTYCCAPLTIILLVTGVMNLLGMALITFAISAERLTGSVNAARLVGAGVLTSGIVLAGRAILILER